MIVLLGCSHRSAPLAFRERLALPEAALPEALGRLLARDEVQEGLILSTCNRVEVLVRAASVEAGVAAARATLGGGQVLEARELERYSYEHHGREAMQHLFRVAAGLDSMILGEPQILGQVKQAYQLAQANHAVGAVLERLMQRCLATAKRVRSETGIGRHAVSVAYAAVQLGRQIFGDLAGRRALLLGAGKMSGLVARHLAAHGVSEIVVASRSFNHAAALAEDTGGRAAHWDDGLAQLARVDIVVSCTDAPHPVLRRDDVARALRSRRGEPLFLIDIAVPRDIDPQVNTLDNAYLYDIDGLQGVVDSSLEERKRAAAAAERMIEAEVDAFLRWRQAQAVGPLVVALRGALFDVAAREVERQRHRLGTLSPEQRRALDELVRGVLRKVLHRPIRHLHGAAERGELEPCITLYDELFGTGEFAAGHPASESEVIAEAQAAAESGSEAAAGAGEEAPRAPRGPQRVLRGGRDGSA